MKTIKISFFKAHISEQLRKVRRGARIIISDRDTPIAEVLPYKSGPAPKVTIREPQVVPFSIPKSTVKINHDPLEYLTEDGYSR